MAEMLEKIPDNKIINQKKQYKKAPKFELTKTDQWDYYYSIAYPNKSGLEGVPYLERVKAFEKLIELSGTEDQKYRKYVIEFREVEE